VVDADTQKAMMAWYYKRQEEEKVRPCAVQQQQQTLPARLLAREHGCWQVLNTES
jgi:hypothetical protein